MTPGVIHVHIDRLVVDEGFDRAGFERALMQSLGQFAGGDWTAQAIDRLRLDPGPDNGSALNLGKAVAVGLRSVAGASPEGSAGGRHGRR